MDKPEISYPCAWDYRVIGRDEARMRDAVAAIVEVDFQLALGHHSENARYCSLQLTVEVRTEAERLALFDALRKDEEILYVL